MSIQISDSELQAEYTRRFRVPAGKHLSGPEDAYRHFQSFMSEKDREYFVATFLTARNQIIATEILFKGTVDYSIVYPRELIKRIINHNAVGVILAHNHPSGNPEPSIDDIKITNKLKQACKLIDATLHDHLVITASNYISMSSAGLI